MNTSKEYQLLLIDQLLDSIHNSKYPSYDTNKLWEMLLETQQRIQQVGE